MADSAFIGKPEPKDFGGLKRTELDKVAVAFGVTIKRGDKKREVQRLIIEHCIENYDWDPDVLDAYPDLDAHIKAQKEERDFQREERDFQREKMNFERISQAAAKAEADEAESRAKAARDEAEKQRVHEKGLIDLKDQARRKASADAPFDPCRYIRMVPQFSEKDIDKYFDHFEKIAISMEWKKNQWTLLLQTVLRGKAQEIYSALPAVDIADYDLVKRAILKAYELVPEAYRLQFRDTMKTDKETHVEFAHQKQVAFDRWCSSKKVEKSFEDLRQMILIEEFKNSLPNNVRIYLEENKVSTLEQAAICADDYTIVHKKHQQSDKARFQGNRKSFGGANKGENSSPKSPEEKRFEIPAANKDTPIKDVICFWCKKRGHFAKETNHILFRCIPFGRRNFKFLPLC